MSREKANERIGGRDAGRTTVSHSIGIVVISAVVIVAILLGFIFYLVLGKDSTENANVVVTPDNLEETISQLTEDDYTPPGSYEVTMNTEWTFPDGKSASTDAYVENCVNNTSTVFFTIALADDDSGDIYKSPYLEIGSHIENITLDKDLDAGTYDAVLTYHLVDSNMEEMSSVSVTITIDIQN